MASQSVEFWNKVGSSDSDVEHLYGFLLERGTPLSSRNLAFHLIEWRVREEERHLTELAARRAPVYQPKNTYAVGQTVLFTALGNREGEVKDVRAGDNPRLGDFEVIRVQMDGETGVHEFAAGYAGTHPLNQEVTQVPVSLGLTPEQAVAEYGDKVQKALVERLSTDKEFVHQGDQWFLKGLMPEIHLGYLNLAEAAIEQAGDAIATAELDRVLDLPQSGKKAAQVFALNHALGHDPRFEDVGPANESRWILTRMEPLEARERPMILDKPAARTTRLPAELELIAVDLYDTADSNGNGRPADGAQSEVTLVLTYPHRRAGTLPLVAPVRAMLPDFSRPRLKINLVDAATEEKFPGYVLIEGNYLAGLAGWFDVRKLSPGAFVTLRRGANPLTLMIDYQPQRERSLWVRVARTMNGRLTFTQEKRPLAHKYDEEMLIVVGDAVAIDSLAQSGHERPLPSLLEEIFPELAKLSGAGRVHAKTLFSAVNFVRRTPPRGVLSALTESHAFASAGGGYFVLREELRH